MTTNLHIYTKRPIDPCWDADYRSKTYVECPNVRKCKTVSPCETYRGCRLLWFGINGPERALRTLFVTLKRPIGWPRKDWFSRPRSDRRTATKLT